MSSASNKTHPGAVINDQRTRAVPLRCERNQSNHRPCAIADQAIKDSSVARCSREAKLANEVDWLYQFCLLNVGTVTAPDTASRSSAERR